MAGFCGIIGSQVRLDFNSLSNSIDLLNNHHHQSFYGKDYYCEVSFREIDPLKGARFYEDDETIALFHGDFIDHDEVPWPTIIDNYKGKKFSFFSSLSGFFSFCFLNKINSAVTLVSDRRAQDPLFYYKKNNEFIFSTDISTFCRLFEAEFNEEWLYEYYFFNFPVSDNTPIKDVFRLGYAEVLLYSKDHLRIKKYAELYKPREPLTSGAESLERANRVFKDRVPAYFKGAENIGCALTSGWDTRTSLAYAPDLEKVTTYTYGIPGCKDLVLASNFAKKMKINNKQIHLDEGFVKKIPYHMLRSVYLSSGMNHVGRSSLSYTYSKLHQDYGFPLIISGIQFDQMFRGHAVVPSMVSYGLRNLIEKRNIDYQSDGFKKLAEYEATLYRKNEELVSRMGNFSSTYMHLLFHVYVSASTLFAGEMKLADHFYTSRVPAWDNDILSLAFSMKESTLSFSQFSDHKIGHWPEMLLQSYLLKKANPKFAKIPVGNITPTWVLKGRIPFKMNNYYNAVMNRMKFPGLRRIPSEDNEYWMNNVHRDFIDKLIFSKTSMIKEYFDNEYLSKLQKTRDKHFIMKILTVEMTLRLIRNKWTDENII